MLAKDFDIIDGARVVTDACYRYLREHNLFTHNIAYPIAAAFITSPEAKGYMLMDFDINALPMEITEELQADAPETYKMYVSGTKSRHAYCLLQNAKFPKDGHQPSLCVACGVGDMGN